MLMLVCLQETSLIQYLCVCVCLSCTCVCADRYLDNDRRWLTLQDRSVHRYGYRFCHNNYRLANLRCLLVLFIFSTHFLTNCLCAFLSSPQTIFLLSTFFSHHYFFPIFINNIYEYTPLLYIAKTVLSSKTSWHRMFCYRSQETRPLLLLALNQNHLILSTKSRTKP